jgi:imidazolonepropionase-like amidohydrolase
MMHKLVKTKYLLDGTGAPLIRGGMLLIKDGKIEDAGVPEKFRHVPQDAEIIDLSEQYVMPGLVNAHTHLTLVPGDGNQPAQKRLRPQFNVLRSTPNILKDMRSGVTTMRIMGEEANIDVDFKNAIETGLIHGPRMIVSALGITASHSHGVTTRPSDGVDEVRKHVRQNFANGADFIKLFATGGASSAGKALHSCPFTIEEISMAVQEAERHGTYVAAHAHGGTGLDYCIDAGVRTIEHGAFINAAQLDRLIKRNAWVVGTFAIMFHPTGIEQSDFRVPLIKEKVLAAREAAAENFARIIKSNCNLAVGTDAMHGLMPYEMEKLVEFGATTMQALLAGTQNAARACRVEDKVGTLEAGKYADFIALGADPVADIRNLKQVKAVYKEGQLFQGI